MSCRGGVGGGRGQPRPSQGPSPGRGGGRVRPFVNQQTQPPVRNPPPTAVASSSTAPFPSPSAVASLSSEVERKVSLTSRPPPAQTAPAVQTPPAAISTQLAPASSKAVRPPVRPGRGILGRKCVVRANRFLIEIADKDIHHYDVAITPEVLSRKVCRDIVNALVSSRESQLGGRFTAYDGRKSFHTAGPLPFTSKDFVVKLNNIDKSSRGDRKFKVAIKFAAKVDLQHLQQFLHSSSFFGPKLGAGYLGDGLDYWKGFYQSLRLTQMGLSLNVDMSARAFYSPILVSEFVQQSLNIRDLSRPLSDQDRIKVTIHSPHEPSMMLLFARFKMFVEHVRVSYVPTGSGLSSGIGAMCAAWSCLQNMRSKQDTDAIEVQISKFNELLIESKKLDYKRNLYLRQTNQYLLETNYYVSRGWKDWFLGTTYNQKYQKELAAKAQTLYLDKLVRAQRKRDQLEQLERDQQQEARETEERRKKIKEEVKHLLIGCFW